MDSMKLLSMILIVISLLFIRKITGLSACDDVDIIFIVDTDSIIYNEENIDEFITRIIWDGSSEDAGFSVIIYGDNIPNNLDINIIDLKETESINQRQKEEEIIGAKLKNVFKSIKQFNDKNGGKSVTLTSAFKTAINQNKPSRSYKKREKLGGCGAVIGAQDDEKEIFIFDFYNKLISADNKNGDDGDICNLFKYDTENDDETIHFLFGSSLFDDNGIYNILCDNKYPSNIKHNTFFELNINGDLLNDELQMESIYDITCPAYIYVDEYGGDINLGNHVQWIDLNTIIKCNIQYIENENDNASPLKLDTQSSYIYIVDYLNDDNTFKLFDYLISDKNTFENGLQDIGCSSPVYKILRIQSVTHDDDQYDESDQYNVLKLYIDLPKTPMEYMLSSHVGGENVTIAKKNGQYTDSYKNNNNNTDRRKLSDLKITTSEKDVTLVDFHLPLSFSFKHTAEIEKEIPFTKNLFDPAGPPPKLTITGVGEIEISVDFTFDLEVNLDFIFDWDIGSDDILIEFKIHGFWEYSAEFQIKLSAYLDILFKNLLNFGKIIVFMIGPVPVIVRPFIAVDIQFVTVPITLNAGISCKYGENFELGYHYKKMTRFIPEYGVVMNNAQYTLPIVKQWNADTIDECAELAYDAGGGRGLTCAWFDYNDSNKKCRCFSGILHGETSYSSGTTTYVMNKSCKYSNPQYKNCNGCGAFDGAFWVEKDKTCDGVGTIPLFCPDGYPELTADLCYKSCKSGYNGEVTTCREECKSNEINDGLYCRIPAVTHFRNSYDRGVGVIPNSCATNQQYQAGLCYALCAAGYYGDGPVCWASCPAGYQDHGATCFKWGQLVISKQSYGRGAGTVPNKCPSNKPEGQGGLCYALCASGYTGTATVCWQNCFGTVVGALCETQALQIREKDSYYRGVGVIKTKCASGYVNELGLCYAECIGHINSDGDGDCIRPYESWWCQDCPALTSNEGYYLDPLIEEWNIEKKESKYPGDQCTKYLQIGEDSDDDGCPEMEFGFDVIIAPKLGVTLYWIFTVYLRAPITIPFRITMPEMDPTLCELPSSTDMCSLNYFRASFTIEMYIEFFLGIGIDLDLLSNFQLPPDGTNDGDESSDFESLVVEVPLGDKITILDRTSLGCTNLDGILEPLNDYFRDIGCCAPTTSTTPYPSIKPSQHPTVSPSTETETGWIYIGNLNEIESLIINKYNVKDYEFAIKPFDSWPLNLIFPIIISGWNIGLRITTINDYPMGDNVESLEFGRSVYTKGLYGAPTLIDWYQYNYILSNNNNINNNNIPVNPTKMYAKKRINSWIEIGVLSDIESLISTYPLIKYEYGVKFNYGASLNVIHSIDINSWNQQILIQTKHSYPMGDDTLNLKFGRLLFSVGLNGDNNWYQYYYYLENDVKYTGPSLSNNVNLFIRELDSEWKENGIISDLPLPSYSKLQYEFAIKYNTAFGSIHQIIANSWNYQYGVRLSTINQYPMGDDPLKLKFGKNVFTKGTASNLENNRYYQYYYYMENDVEFWSNGISDNTVLYIKENINNWQYVGILSDIENLLKNDKYPLTNYEYGIPYNNVHYGFIHRVIINYSFNQKYIQISTINNYPMGDDSKKLKFGKVIYSKSIDDNDWFQYYYYINDNKYVSSNNGNTNNLKVYVRDINNNNNNKSQIKQYHNKYGANNKYILLILLIISGAIISGLCWYSIFRKNNNKTYKSVDIEAFDQESAINQ